MEKSDKKKIKQEYKNKQKQLFLESLPMKKELFLALFDYLDEKGDEGCNHDLTLTEAFLKDKGVDIAKVIDFLEENGGYCDCEVLYNVEELFDDISM